MSIINKIIIFFVVFFVLILAVLFYIIMPTIHEIKKLNQYIYQEQKDLELKFQIGKKNKEIRKNFLKIKPSLSQLDNIYLKKDKKIELFTFLEKIAQKHNLELNIDLLPLGSSEKIVSLKLELEGEYFDFLKYLIDLEKFDLYININEILINDITSKTPIEDFSAPSFLNNNFQKEKIEKEKFGKIKATLFGKIYQKEKDFFNDNLF